MSKFLDPVFYICVLTALFMWTKPVAASLTMSPTPNCVTYKEPAQPYWFHPDAERAPTECLVVKKKHHVRHVHRVHYRTTAALHVTMPRPALGSAYGAGFGSRGDIYQAVRGTVVEGLWREYETWRVRQQAPAQ